MVNANHMQLEEMNVMSHIHIPDGVARDIWWLLVLGYVATFLLLFFILRKIDREETGKRIPLVGIMSAIMLITMSVPLGFIPFHLNLASLCGIMVGPGLGFIAVFVVNLVLAFMGHGGITVVGLNTLIIGVEVFLGNKLYNIFMRRQKANISSALATFIALIVSTAITFGVVFLITGSGEAILNGHHGDGSTSFLGYSGWIAISIILFIGIVLESVISAMIVSFLSKVKPELVEPDQKHR